MARNTKKNRRKAVKQSDAIRIDLREVGKLVAVSMVVIVLIWVSKKVDDIPIKTIEIQSELEKVNKSDIKTIAMNYMHDGFFTVNLSAFERQLNDIPWVYRASIKRQWPSKVVITITEQQPYFRWGDKHLINKYGETFFVDDVSDYSHMPLLKGVAGREKQLIDLYYKYSDGFKQMGGAIISFKEDARYDKEIQLANGIIISLGREHSDKQIQRCLDSFAMFSKAERNAIVSIDLRHSNGFAVRWNS